MEDERKELIDELTKIVDTALKEGQEEGALGDDDYLGTWVLPLGNYNGNDWAIVVAWMDYDNDGTWRLFGKVAYQPNNSMMQCDYDIDWLMPYDEKTGEVADTEIGIQDTNDIEWLIKEWYEMKDIYPYTYYEVQFGSGTGDRYVLKVDEPTTDYGALTDCLIDYLVEKGHPSILNRNEYEWVEDEPKIIMADGTEITSDQFVEGGNCGDVLMVGYGYYINPISVSEIGDAEIVEVV